MALRRTLVGPDLGQRLALCGTLDHDREDPDGGHAMTDLPDNAIDVEAADMGDLNVYERVANLMESGHRIFAVPVEPEPETVQVADQYIEVLNQLGAAAEVIDAARRAAEALANENEPVADQVCEPPAVTSSPAPGQGAQSRALKFGGGLAQRDGALPKSEPRGLDSDPATPSQPTLAERMEAWRWTEPHPVHPGDFYGAMVHDLGLVCRDDLPTVTQVMEALGLTREVDMTGVEWWMLRLTSGPRTVRVIQPTVAYITLTRLGIRPDDPAARPDDQEDADE